MTFARLNKLIIMIFYIHTNFFLALKRWLNNVKLSIFYIIFIF
jgi:hypothetical protein